QDRRGELAGSGLHAAVPDGLEHADHACVLHARDGGIGQLAELIGLQAFREEGVAVSGDLGKDRARGGEGSGHREAFRTWRPWVAGWIASTVAHGVFCITSSFR